jgi:mono/diheme cytochrome c family protein
MKCAMKLRSISALVLLATLWFGNVGFTAPRMESAPAPESTQFFQTKIFPILSQNCYRCHGGRVPGRLRLDSREEILKGGKRGPAIVPGDPDASLLVQAVRQSGQLKMPLGGKLSDQDVADLAAWVKMGAPWADVPQSMPAASQVVNVSSAGNDLFTNSIRPLLVNQCFPCHSDSAESGLRVDSRAALLKGGTRGAAIVPGDPEKSILIQAVEQTGELKMPKGGAKLSPEEVQNLITWIKMGAPWSESEHAQPIVLAVSAPAGSSAGDDYFENKIRPLLINNCMKCHGSLATSGLRVDSRESLLKGGDSGLAAIVPGSPEKSFLIQAVQQTGPIKMPKGGKLATEDVQNLVEWVRMGAPWPKSKQLVATSTSQFKISPEQRSFWSFQPLKADSVPAVKNTHWAKTSIDKFVLAKLESQGIQPAPVADRRTLIRRATFDLTGLPPTPEEIESFEKDKSPKAFEKVVDRLLASPRYGERWGRHWLDVARYAEDDVRGLDPKGRGYMPFNGAYVYRDWVIKAVNDDLPYDQFVRAQLAGDLVGGNDLKTILPATAFLGGGPWLWDQAEPVQGRADERNERIDAVTRGLLGLTVACARCHDHKYDPIGQKDYYALAGVFASSTYKEYPLVSETQVAAYRQKEQQLLDLQEQMDNFTKTESEQLASVLAAQTSQYMVAAWKVSGKPKATVNESAEQSHVDPELLERWVKFLAQPPRFYPYLKDWQAMIATGGTEDEAKALADSFQDLVLKTEADAKKIKEENDVIKAKADVKKRSRKDALPNEFETDDQFCPGCSLELKALPTEQASLWVSLFMRSLQSTEEKPEPGLFVFRRWALKRRLSPEWQDYLSKLEKQIDATKKSLPEQYPFVHGISDKPTLINIAVNLRGNPHILGEEVPRRFIAVLTPPEQKSFSQGSGRLELANDIVESPLAMRVFVNRVWKWHFGSGIVATPDNFGVAGERPSNPELLDYLAASFKQNGMSLKKLQKEIMLSAAYQTSAQESAEAHEKDGANRFYSHFNRQRLDAESIRDSILFVAGDLDLKKTGGPSTDFGPDNTRRTVYCKVSRFRLNNYLQVFDFPNPSFTAEQRFSTNVPLQRLYFMNNDFVYMQAGKLAERVYAKSDDTARISEAYRLLYGRAPTPKEIELGLQFLKTTPEKPGYAVHGEPFTAWREYARVLLSANEFEFIN